MDGKDQQPEQPGQTTGPEGRSTTFQAVQGEPEHYSGTTLLVTAYAAIWTILLVWVAMAWRRQSALNARLDDLERVIDAADARSRASAGDKSEEKPAG
jgi:CcmD family protein